MISRFLRLSIPVAFAACAGAATAAVPALAAPAAGATGAPSAPPAQAAIVVPPDKLYVCVTDAGGVRSQAPIEFATNVYPLCAKHPEMGPCQYARNECRRRGGRVYAPDGKEITMQTEAEYDKKVMRVKVQ
jgi:hypothetical protein